MLLRRLFYALFALATAVLASPRPDSGPAYDGTELDYQPELLRIEPDQRLMLVFERLDVSTLFGDLLVTFSSDDGATWTTPQPVVATANNERHPALVQLGLGSFVMFYLVDETGGGSYRIHRATSADGVSWTSHGAIDLGWADAKQVNPDVILEEDGSLTMTYQRLSTAVFIARSTDGGVTWDRNRTRISAGVAALPRLAKRESDGLYLVTYQTGGSTVKIWSKASTDPYDWSGGPVELSVDGNSHDPDPIVLEGGTFLVTYSHVTASAFDVFFKTSFDGETWSEPTRHTFDGQHFDTQSHPLRSGTPGRVILSWSHQESAASYVDHDVWVDNDLAIPLPLWLDVDSLSASTGGTVNLALDAGIANAGRGYVVCGSTSGTSPGVTLPGGLATIPLNWDAYTLDVIANLNTPTYAGFLGALDASGRATATIDTQGPLSPATVGLTVYYAYALRGPWDFASNPVAVAIKP